MRSIIEVMYVVIMRVGIGELRRLAIIGEAKYNGDFATAARSKRFRVLICTFKRQTKAFVTRCDIHSMRPASP